MRYVTRVVFPESCEGVEGVSEAEQEQELLQLYRRSSEATRWMIAQMAKSMAQNQQADERFEASPAYSARTVTDNPR